MGPATFTVFRHKYSRPTEAAVPPGKSSPVYEWTTTQSDPPEEYVAQ